MPKHVQTPIMHAITEILGAADNEATDHSSQYVADELGIDYDDLRRWEDQQLDAYGYVRADE